MDTPKLIEPEKNFNPTRFYRDGFSMHRIEDLVDVDIRGIEKEIKERDLKESDKYADGSMSENPVYDYRPSYEQMREMAPDVAFQAAKELYMSQLFSFFHEAFDLKIVDIDLWNGVEDQAGKGLPWHWDGLEGSTMNMLVYFSNEKQWQEQWGGVLEVGKRLHMQENALNEGPRFDSEVEPQWYLPPEDGNILILNNTNPYLVHRVRPAHEARDRRVLSICVKLRAKESPDQPSQLIY